MEWLNRIGRAKKALAQAKRQHARAKKTLRRSGYTCAGAACCMVEAQAAVGYWERELSMAKLLFLCE